MTPADEELAQLLAERGDEPIPLFDPTTPDPAPERRDTTSLESR